LRGEHEAEKKLRKPGRGIWFLVKKRVEEGFIFRSWEREGRKETDTRKRNIRLKDAI